MQSRPIVSAIKETLGFGSSRVHIASSCILIINIIFFLYTVSSQIKLGVYPFYFRVTYYTLFDAHIISQSIDNIILFSSTAAFLLLSLKGVKRKISSASILAVAAAFQATGMIGWPLDMTAMLSTPVVIALLILDKATKGSIFSVRLETLGSYFGLTSLLLAITGLIIATSFTSGLQDQSLRNISYELFLIFYSLSPILILVLIASLPVKLLIEGIRNSIRRRNDISKDHSFTIISRRRRFYYLSFFVILSIIIGIIPHLPTINKDNQKIGVDTGYYVNWVGALYRSQTGQQFIENAFVTQADGDRPITLIFIYAISNVVNTDFQTVVEYLPIILGPGLVLITFWLTREVTRDEMVSLIASFITAVSFHTLIGIYAGFYSNWFALIVGYAGIIFLLRYLREYRIRDLAVFSALLFFTLFSHVYTWSVIAIVMGVFLAVTFVRNQDKRKASAIMLIILASSVAVDLARATFTEATGGMERDLKLADNLTGPDQFNQRWSNLRYTSTTFVGGIFGNVVILALGLYWMYKSQMDKTSTILLLAFFSVGIIPILIGDWIVQTRILYDIPFQIPAAIALSQIRDKPKGNILFASICVWLVFIAVRTASNFYFISPT